MRKQKNKRRKQKKKENLEGPGRRRPSIGSNLKFRFLKASNPTASRAYV